MEKERTLTFKDVLNAFKLFKDEYKNNLDFDGIIERDSKIINNIGQDVMNFLVKAKYIKEIDENSYELSDFSKSYINSELQKENDLENQNEEEEEEER